MRGSPLSGTEIEPVLRTFEEASPLPGRAYVDEEVFRFELDRAFARSWICVGRRDEVELPGQWLRASVSGEPILVVRGADLELRGFFDVCRHRGLSIVGAVDCGRAARFECPYHGWIYELDGRLTRPMAEASLKSVRVSEWYGFVFVTLANETASCADWLEPAPPWLSVDLPLRRGRRTTWETAANWKLLVENFQESHHFPLVHRSLESITPTAEAQSWLPGRGHWLGGTMEIVDAETVSMDRSRHGRPLVSKEPRVFDAMLFPGLFTSLQPDYLLTYRLTPLAEAQTRVTADIHFHPAAFTSDFEPDDVYAFWDRVNAEDRAICEAQQANMTSRAFAPRYAPVEEGLHAFHRMIAKLHQ